MRLFTVGPVEMFDHTLEIRSKQIPYFRCQEFSNVMLEIEERLKVILKTHIDSKCAILTGSGTAAMESVISCSLDKNDRILIINGGGFGSRFIQLCKIYQIPFDEVLVPFDEELTIEHLVEFDTTKYTALLVNMHETSIGKLYDIKMLSSYCKSRNMKLIVDAISSFLSDEIKMDEFGIDCIILSSQKALALAPGLSMVVMNESFFIEKVEPKPIKNMYLNLKLHIENMKRGQTPFTPAVGICYELLDMLRNIQEKGVQNIMSETYVRAHKFRKKLEKIGLKTPSFPLSNTLTPILFDNGKAYEVYTYLKDTYDIYVTPSGGDLQGKLLRVGHIGAIKDEYYDELLNHLMEVM